MLGVSTKHAHARMSRARTQFEGALGALLLARTGRERCPSLADMLQGWDGKLTVLLRKRIDRHARDCDVCGAERRDRMRPAELFAAYSALPFLAMARHVGADGAPVTRLQLKADAVHDKPARDGVRRATIAGGVAIIVLLALGAAVGLSRNLLLAEPSGTPSPIAISASPDIGLVAPSATPTSGPSTTPVTTTTSVIVPFKVSGTVKVSNCSTLARMWEFNGTVSGGTLASATLHYLSMSVAMTVSANAAKKTVTVTGNPRSPGGSWPWPRMGAPRKPRT